MLGARCTTLLIINDPSPGAVGSLITFGVLLV
jgi:hypothetical protein